MKDTGIPQAPNDLHQHMIKRVDKDGTTYIPEAMAESLNLYDKATRFKANVALGLGVLASGGVLCTGTVAILEFVRGCSNETIMRSLAGFEPVSTAQCVQEGFQLIGIAIRHFWSW